MTVRKRWDRFWFEPAAADNLIAARVIIAMTGLWLIASRPMLPDVVRWPDPFWNRVNIFVRIRYLILPLPFAIEMTLYTMLTALLVSVMLGRALRASALIAALLMYHFAPMEDIFASSGGPFFRGFTLPLLALVIVGIAPKPRRGDVPSGEFRWPVVLTQLLFAFTYLLSGLSKLRIAGFSWLSGRTFESIVLAMRIPDTIPPWAHFFVGHPILCWVGAVTGAAMDFLFIGAVFSPRAARVIVPLTLVAHLVIIRVLGVVFLGMPMLLLFVNWEWITSRVRRPVARHIEIAATE